MNTFDSIHGFLPAILQKLESLQPDKVILFGSYADGTALPDSDLDLLLVLDSDLIPQTYAEKQANYLKAARVLRDIRQQMSIDLLVHTRATFARMFESDSQFANRIREKGIILYEKQHT
ncbi:MAG: hypothetical protein OHK0052_22630 [Anaerolineales bacterium]